MGDYVLESNPALDRLIERFRAQGAPLLPETPPNSNSHAKRSRRGKRSKVRSADHPEEVFPGAPTADDASHPAEYATVAKQLEPTVVEDDLWAIHEDSQSDDEMVLLDFDEEPAVFDEDPEYDHDEDEDDQADEILDVYEDDEADDEQIELAGRELVDEGTEVLDKDRVDAGDWIFDAFEAWKIDVEDRALHDEEDLEAFDEDENDADDFIDIFDEDIDGPPVVAGSPHEESELTSPATSRQQSVWTTEW